MPRGYPTAQCGNRVLECADADEALAWARKVPLREGAIEIRPIMELSHFGYESRTLARACA
jgi:hypothetical protein